MFIPRLQHALSAALGCYCMLASGCRTTNPQDSAVKVTNGLSTASVGGFEAVIAVNMGAGACTGTFINSVTVLTAAHCLGDNFANEYPVTVGGESSVESHFYANAFPNPAASKGLDIAILKFPPRVSTSLIYAPITLAFTTPRVGDKVTLVGFGQTNDNDANSAGSKHYGTNTISRVDSLFIAVDGVLGPTATPGISVAGDHGDSGSPLLNSNRQIIGVASRAEKIGTSLRTWYTRVPNDNNRELLARYASSPIFAPLNSQPIPARPAGP